MTNRRLQKRRIWIMSENPPNEAIKDYRTYSEGGICGDLILGIYLSEKVAKENLIDHFKLLKEEGEGEFDPEWESERSFSYCNVIYEIFEREIEP